VAEESLEGGYFDALYAGNPDPWGFQTRPYEASKYALTLATIPQRRPRHALELGCSIGVLSQRLGRRCERVLAVDVADAALAQARERCRDQPHVRFRRMQVPRQMPDGIFDLILLSEMGYYLSRADLRALRQALLARLLPGGSLLLVHWRPEVADYPLTGDEVHELFLESDSRLRHRRAHRDEFFRLDLWERTPASSTA